MTTFDRYLLQRFLYVFLVFLLTTYGLFVVIDGFSNVDGFQEGIDRPGRVLLRMAGYYAYQSSLFFDMVAAILCVLSAMVVFAMLERHSEIHPILAAGVPTFRLVVPVLAGTLLIAAAIVLNRELIIPRIDHHLRAPRSGTKPNAQDVQPGYDRAGIWIGGEKLIRGTNRMLEPEFILPPEIAEDLTPLRAAEATYHREKSSGLSGWVLHDVRPRADQLRLTEVGSRVVRRTSDPKDLFVATNVSFDQLLSRSQNSIYASTPELLRRIRNPSFGSLSARSLSLHVHARLVQPALLCIAVVAVVPLICRRESAGLVTNLAVCTVALGLMFGATQLCLYLGRANLIGPSLAACAPVVVNGTFAAWLSGLVQT